MNTARRLPVLLKLTLAAVLSVMALTVAVAPASAAALPPGYKPNGCTLSPDRGWAPTYYDFKSICNTHDYCYDETWYGANENGRAQCDSRFLNEMRGWCNNYYASWRKTAERVKCNGVAWAYYLAVRAAGRPFFNNPNLN